MASNPAAIKTLLSKHRGDIDPSTVDDGVFQETTLLDGDVVILYDLNPTTLLNIYAHTKCTVYIYEDGNLSKQISMIANQKKTVRNVDIKFGFNFYAIRRN